MSPDKAFEYLVIGVLCVIGILLLLVLIKTIKGPRISDRLVTVNITGTLITTTIAILAVYFKGQSYLIDVCIIYVLISFLAVLVFTNVYINRYIATHKDENIVPTIDETKKELPTDSLTEDKKEDDK